MSHGVSTETSDLERRLYTPLDEAVAELPKRRADPAFCREVRAFQKQHPLEFSWSEPRAILTRCIHSADFEFQRFLQLADRSRLEPLCLQLSKDRYVHFNPDKLRRAILKFGSSKPFVKLPVIDLSPADGKCISTLATLNGIPLVDFHHRLLEVTFPHREPLRWVREIGDWALRCTHGYIHYLALGLLDGIHFEVFYLEDAVERRFVEERVLPSIEKLISHFGVGPLFVPLFSQDEQHGALPWNYPHRVRGIASAMLAGDAAEDVACGY